MNAFLKTQIIVFCLCFACNLTRHALMESWNVSKDHIETELGFSSFTLGLIDMLFLFSYATGNVVNGILADKYNTKHVLCIGMLVSSLIYCCVRFIQILFMAVCYYKVSALYCLFFSVTGFFQGSVWVCTVTIMSNWFTLHNRGKVLGFWIINTSVGNVIGSQLGSGLLQLGLKWQLMIIIFLYLFSTSFFLTFLFCIEKPGHFEELKQAKRSLPVLKALKLPGVLPYSLLIGCTKLLHYSFFMWLPLFATQKLDLSDYYGGVLASCYDLGGILASIIIGWFSDRLTDRIFAFFPLLIGVLPFIFCIAFVSSQTVWIFFFIIPIIGFGIGGVTNLVSSVVAADLGQATHGDYDCKTTIVGIIDGSGSIGAGIGQIIIGSLSSHSWESVFIFLFIVNFLAIIDSLPLLVKALKNRKNEG